MPINPSAPQHKRCAERSFPTNDLRGLGDCIQDDAYTFQPSRSMRKHVYYVNQGALVIRDHARSILVQGGAPERAIVLFGSLVTEDEQRRWF